VTVRYLCPGSQKQGRTIGGLRKLYQHVAVLNAAGIDAEAVEVGYEQPYPADPGDLLVFPEVYRRQICDDHPGIPRVVFCQNAPYVAGSMDQQPWGDCPDLRGVIVVSRHNETMIRSLFPGLAVPVVRVTVSVLGDVGGDRPFWLGSWPRARQACYFAHKRPEQAGPLVERLAALRPDWTFINMQGTPRAAKVAETMRTSAVFLSVAGEEGCPLPPREALVCGAAVVGYSGGGGDDFFHLCRQVPDADLDAFVAAADRLMGEIEADPMSPAEHAVAASKEILAVYDRAAEETEIVATIKGFL
jgi:hypothetical protein